ncbi:MAG: hypothetical protein ABSG16_20000, partial [Candidatus Acidiferrum sp.]
PPNEHPGRAVHVLGFADAPKNMKGTLVVDGAALKLKPKDKAQHEEAVPITSIDDVLTGKDSVRAVGGTLGTISMLGPYGSGRFLSLFRKKTSTLTVEYHDAAGGVHGAIFSLDEGQSEPLKKQLVAAGAKTSVPIEDTPPPAPAKSGSGGAR